MNTELGAEGEKEWGENYYFLNPKETSISEGEKKYFLNPKGR